MQEWLPKVAGLLLKEDAQKVVNALQFKPECFPRSMHICKSRDFTAIYTGKRVSGSMFIIYYNILGSIGKAGFTVSKKVSKSAVKRNKLKRRLREIYRQNRNLLPAGVAIIIRVLPQAAGADFNEIKNEVLSLFKVIASKEHSSNVS